jgi:hypothetical protein
VTFVADVGFLLSTQALLLDVHLKEEAISVLMSYNPFWLRLGLETVVGSAVTAGRQALEQPHECRCS